MVLSVYVDEPFVESRGKRWAHLTADSADELHAFAKRLGLLRQSFQATPDKPWKDHYDVTESTRELAVRMGAIPESAKSGVARRRKARREARERFDAPRSSSRPQLGHPAAEPGLDSSL